jgi:hypothetical protein
MLSKFNFQPHKYISKNVRFYSNQAIKFQGKDHIVYYGPAQGAFQLLQNRDADPLKGKHISCYVYTHWTQFIHRAFWDRPYGQNPFSSPMFWQALHIKNKGFVNYSELLTWKETADVHTALQEVLLSHSRESNGFNVQVMQVNDNIEKFLPECITVRDKHTNQLRKMNYLRGHDVSKSIFINNGQEPRNPTLFVEDGLVKMYPYGKTEKPTILCRSLSNHNPDTPLIKTISPEDTRLGIYSKHPEEILAQLPQGFKLGHYGLGFVGAWHIETFTNVHGECHMVFIAPKKELPDNPRNSQLSLDKVSVFMVGDPNLQIGVDNGVIMVQHDNEVHFMNELYASANYRPTTEKTLSIHPGQVIHTHTGVSAGVYCNKTKETSRSVFFCATPDGEVTQMSARRSITRVTTSDVPIGSMPDRYANLGEQIGLSSLRDPRFITFNEEAFKRDVRHEAAKAGDIDIDDEVFERYKRFIEDCASKSKKLAKQAKQESDPEQRKELQKESLRLANPLHPMTYIKVFVKNYVDVMKEKNWQSIELIGKPLAEVGIDYQKNAELLESHLIKIAKEAYLKDKELIEPLENDNAYKL